MKMENILTAEKSGTISSIKVNLGDTIIQDQLIMQIK
jgi:biotin carboxyl carrier protein